MGILRKISQPSPRTRLAILTLAALFTFAGCVKNPVSGESELSLMSPAQEIQLGQENFPQTTQINNGLPADDPELQRYVNTVGQNLARASHRPDLPWEFNVVNSSQINAFALPGGKISITRGLITKMNNEDELAAVLGHEIGHVTARHSAQQYTRGVLISVAALGAGVALSGSDYAEAGVLASGVAGSLLLLSYSRDMERQADELGYLYMTQNGYNPEAMVNVFLLFKSMRKTEPGMLEAFLSSHPLDDERIAAAQRRAQASDPRLTSQPFKTAEFNRALAKQKQRAPAYAAMDKGDAAFDKNNFSQAAKHYREAIRQFPKEGLFHSRLALSLDEMGDKKAALAAAEKGASLSPNTFFCNFVAGYANWEADRFQQAARHFSRADSLLPSNSLNKLLLAASYDRSGQRRQAVLNYRQVQRLAPNTQYGRIANQRLRQMGAY